MADGNDAPLIALETRVFERQTQMLWRLAEDLFRNTHLAHDSSEGKASARGMFRSPSAPATGLQLIGLDSAKIEVFPPTVALLAGVCWQRFGIDPDFASLTLLADGDDYLGWHTDHDAMIGPGPGHADLVTFSFGASRRLAFATIGGPLANGAPTMIQQHMIPGGSAYRMHRAAQRFYMHSVPRVTGKAQVGARLSITFFSAQRGDPTEVWWTLVDARPGVHLPIFAGPATDAFARACVTDHAMQIVTPLGITDSVYGAAEYLKQLGLFEDRHDRMLVAERSRRLVAIKPERSDEDVVTAEVFLATMTCSRCGGAAGSLRVVEETYNMICSKLSGVGTIRLCIGCVQQLLGRPLQPRELEVDPINRPVLQAFALGCDHNGLAERRAEALGMVELIDREMASKNSH